MENNICESKLFRGIILGMGCAIILVFVFGMGVFVGKSRANFSFRWAESYHRNFGGPQGGFLGNMMNDDFTNANGVFGQIIKIDPSAGSGQANITIKGGDGIEKIILAGEETVIVRQMGNIKLSELKIGDTVIVIGEPNNSGQINAGLIRVMPTSPKNLPSMLNLRLKNI